MGDAFADPLDVLTGDDGIGRQELDERDAAHLVLAEAGGDGDLGKGFLGELRIDLEGAQRLDLVAEEVDAVGVFGGIAEDVEDGAAHGILTGFIDVIDALEASVKEHFGHELLIDLLLLVQGEDGVVHFRVLGHLFGESLGIGHHQEGIGRGTFGRRVVVALDDGLDGRERLGAQDLVGRVDLSVLDAALVAAGEERHGVLAADLTQVVVEVAGLLLVVEDEDDDAIDGILEGCQEGGSCRTREALELDDGKLRGLETPKFLNKCVESGLLQHQVFDLHKQKTETSLIGSPCGR